MHKANYRKYVLQFKKPSGTSRGILHAKESWFLRIENDNKTGIGEVGFLDGLSPEKQEEIEPLLNEICKNPLDKKWLNGLLQCYPSVQFGLEQALTDYSNGGKRILFPSAFSNGEKGIPINGLVWMGSKDQMRQELKEKIDQGYKCVKLKIGAIDFNEELELLKLMRKNYTTEEIEIRVDANGAFNAGEALEKLKRLSEYGLHSIEQPIRAGQWQEMAALCEKSPVKIALDEELIGIYGEEKEKLIHTIHPSYLILKPSLLGGFKASEEWISLSGKYNCGWWATSMLESNIGLNAIAQWVFTLNTTLPQGLGTGQLYANNFDSPLEIEKGKLYYKNNRNWNLDPIHF